MTALPYLLVSGPWGRRGCAAARALGSIPPAAGRRHRALAPFWCVALMLSKAYLLLGFISIHSAYRRRGSPPACATFPERACSRCGQHYRLPEPAACPQTLTADSARAARTLVVAFPVTLPCPPHSSDATQPSLRGAGRPRAGRCVQMVRRQRREALVVSSPRGLIDISVT